MTKTINLNPRVNIADARRIVVKIGSRVLVQKTGRPDVRRMRSLVKELAALHHCGREIILVTSGAVGAGMEVLGLKQRPAKLPELQMAAAIGQTRLMAKYEKMFAAQKVVVGQVLLTHDGLRDRARHLNARNTMLCMIKTGIMPVVNENDTVAVEEIKFGDNDILASLVCHLVQADLLILLTTSDGLRQRLPSGRTKRVKIIEKIDADVLSLVEGKGSHISTGGMASKLMAARDVIKFGACVVIADGRKNNVLGAIMNGADTGTLALPAPSKKENNMPGRKRWIAFFHRPAGRLIIDNGAKEAIVKKNKSLLPIGVKKVEGEFGVGAAVEIKTADNILAARGLVSYSSGDIRRIMGKKSSEIARILGSKDYDEVIHKDNMVILSEQQE